MIVIIDLSSMSVAFLNILNLGSIRNFSFIQEDYFISSFSTILTLLLFNILLAISFSLLYFNPHLFLSYYSGISGLGTNFLFIAVLSQSYFQELGLEVVSILVLLFKRLFKLGFDREELMFS